MKDLFICLFYLISSSGIAQYTIRYDDKKRYVEFHDFLFKNQKYSKTKIDSVTIGGIKFEEEYFFIKTKLNYYDKQIDGFAGPVYSGTKKKNKLKISFIYNTPLLKENRIFNFENKEIYHFNLNHDTISLTEISPYKVLILLPYIEDSKASNSIIQIEILNKKSKYDDFLEPPIRSYYLSIKLINFGNILSYYKKY